MLGLLFVAADSDDIVWTCEVDAFFPKNPFALPDLADMPRDNDIFLLGALAGGVASLFVDEEVDGEFMTGPDARERPVVGLLGGLEGPLGGTPRPSVVLPGLSPLDLGVVF